MWLWNRLTRVSNFGMLAIVTLGIFWACQVTQDAGHTYLNIVVDTSFTKYDKVTVVVLDNQTGAMDTVFNQHLTDIGQLSKIPDENYQGQKVSIIITGFRNGQIAYQEVRQYDGQNPGNTTVVVVDSVVAVDSVRVSAHSLILKKGGPPKEVSAAVHPANAIQGVLWNSTDVNIATVTPKDGDPTHALVTPLALGPVMIVVSSQKDPAKTDTLRVTVIDSGAQTSSNANLSALTISAGVLDNPAFSPQARVSGTTVANSVSSIAITATAEDPTAHLVINGAAAISGAPSAPIPLSVGVDSIYVVVTAQDGTLKTYAVAITRTASSASNNLLYTLTLSTGTLNNPVFNPNNRVSGAIVPNSVDSIAVIATVADTLAHLTINGTATRTGTPSGRIPLALGGDSIYVVVTAQDGGQRTYAIGITRAILNAHTNANLAALTASAGPLNAPAFNPETRVSGAVVANSVASTTVTATVADTTARISINGIPVASGTASASIPLDVGVDSIFVLVTAQDGTKNTYVIGITRAAAGPSSNAKLATLTLSAGTLNAPAFDATKRVSGIAVANSVSSTTVTATLADTTARLTIGTTPTGGTATASGVASAAIPLAVGGDSIYVVVTAKDGTKNTYAIGITRAAPNSSSNANLSALTISAGTLNAPAFSPASRVSGTSVANSVSSTTVTATVADSTAHLTINGVTTASGAASAAIPLAAGVDSIFVVVTAQDGTKNTYAIGITRAKSSNANLSALTVAAGILNAPAFDATKRVSGLAVSNSIASTTVTATVADTSARLTIGTTPTGGTATASGVASAAIPLAVGVDSIYVVVTAQDGTKNTYVIGITKAASSDGSLATLTVTPGTLSPALTAGTEAYTVNYTTDSTISVKATPKQAGATMTWGLATGAGATLTAGTSSAPIAVPYGSTAFHLVVTAPDGTKTTYLITVKRTDTVPPNAPTVASPGAKVYTASPTWTWTSGGRGGNGTYRYQFDNPTFPATGFTTTTAPSISPVLTGDGTHTLYVQESDAAGNWSASGSASTFVMFGPASWYKFNGIGDYTDYGFNKNTGTTQSALTFVPSPKGTVNNAVSFDGTTYLTLGKPTYPTANANITFTCWIKVDTTNSAGFPFWGQMILYAGGSGDGSTTAFVSLGVNDSTSPTDPPLRQFANAQIPADTWTHIAGTFDGTNIKLYINGAYIGAPFTFPAAGYPALEGLSSIGYGNDRPWANGAIDDVRIYNRILTDAEINNISAIKP